MTHTTAGTYTKPRLSAEVKGSQIHSCAASTSPLLTALTSAAAMYLLDGYGDYISNVSNSGKGKTKASDDCQMSGKRTRPVDWRRYTGSTAAVGSSAASVGASAVKNP